MQREKNMNGFLLYQTRPFTSPFRFFGKCKCSPSFCTIVEIACSVES